MEFFKKIWTNVGFGQKRGQTEDGLYRQRDLEVRWTE